MKKTWLVQYILNVLCGFWTDRILSFLRPWARSQRAREPRSLSSKAGRRRQSQAWSANTWWSTNGARWWVRRWILVLLRFCFPTKMVTYYLKKTTFNLDWPSRDFFLIFPITNPLWLGNWEDFISGSISKSQECCWQEPLQADLCLDQCLSVRPQWAGNQRYVLCGWQDGSGEGAVREGQGHFWQMSSSCACQLCLSAVLGAVRQLSW